MVRQNITIWLKLLTKQRSKLLITDLRKGKIYFGDGFNPRLYHKTPPRVDEEQRVAISLHLAKLFSWLLNPCKFKEDVPI